jgi:hypothetical protein
MIDIAELAEVLDQDVRTWRALIPERFLLRRVSKQSILRDVGSTPRPPRYRQEVLRVAE